MEHYRHEDIRTRSYGLKVLGSALKRLKERARWGREMKRDNFRHREGLEESAVKKNPATIVLTCIHTHTGSFHPQLGPISP